MANVAGQTLKAQRPEKMAARCMNIDRNQTGPFPATRRERDMLNSTILLLHAIRHFRFWPSVETPQAAAEAADAMAGLVLARALLGALLGTLLLVVRPGAGAPLLGVAGAYGALAWGLHRRLRTAAVVGLVIETANAVVALMGGGHWLWSVFWALGFLGAVRATVLYNKLRGNGMPSVLKPTVVLMALYTMFALTAISEARDLADTFVRGFPTEVLGQGDLSAGIAAFSPAFAGAISQAVTQAVPLASTAPAFSYRYNPALSIFERSTTVPGPLFSERALTVGRGQLNFGVGYAFLDFSTLNGTSLQDLRSPGLVGDEIGSGTPQTVIPVGLSLAPGETITQFPESGSTLRTRLDLSAHIVVPAVRYGLTDNWEVSLAIPLVTTSLRVKTDLLRVADLDPTKARLFIVTDAQGNFSRFGYEDPTGHRLLTGVPPMALAELAGLPFVRSVLPPQPQRRAAGSATGVGDIALRTKYQLWDSGAGGAALGLAVQLPSGDVRNFHGTGETHVSTSVYLSQVLRERFEPHLNLGLDWNANDVNRSSFLYTVGISVLVWRQLAVLVDVLGRDEFARFPVHIPDAARYEGLVLDRAASTCTSANPCHFDVAKGFIAFPFFPGKIHRNDTVDFSFGLRYVLGTSGSVFFGGIVPLNNDGLRADFIPSGGIEWTF